ARDRSHLRLSRRRTRRRAARTDTPDPDVGLAMTGPRVLRRVIWLYVATAFCVLAIGRAAWLSDDAYITLRTIDNVWNGYGLRWNVVERVQAYTHPLWMLLLAAAYGITREAQVTTFAVSFLCVGLMLALLIRRLSTAAATLALVCLVSSR